MTNKPILFSTPMVHALLAGTKTQTRRIFKVPTKGEYVRADMGGWEVSTVGGKGVYLRDGTPTPEEPCVWNRTTGTTIVPRIAVGDRLWVKETWRTYVSLEKLKPTLIWSPEQDRGAAIFYEAGGGLSITRTGPRVWDFAPDDEPMPAGAGKIRVSIHMPMWASRLLLPVLNVRVQRLQDITEEDALAEGIVLREKSGDYWVPGLQHPNKDFPYLSRPTAREMYAALWDTINGSGEWGKNPFVVAYSFQVLRLNIFDVLRRIDAPRNLVAGLNDTKFVVPV